MATPRYQEWCDLEAAGRARGERFPEGACCENCGRRGTLRGSAFCADCRELVCSPAIGDCPDCGHPLRRARSGYRWDELCDNDDCPPVVLIRRIAIAIFAAAGIIVPILAWRGNWP